MAKLYIVNFNRESDTPDWRIYRHLRNARAAVTLATKSKRYSHWHDDAQGGTIYEIDEADLTSVEQHGNVDD